MNSKIVVRYLIVCSLTFCVGLSPTAHAQDTTRLLKEVIIKAYRSERPLSEVPVSISVVTPQELSRFSNSSILPVINTLPGVRMEERSPGSYRFSIRGSLLRSPFGVRNVKFYWNNLPLTDGGGNTYLNLLDFNSIGSIEILKGPGASLYGAGTGGVVLLQAPSDGPPLSLSLLYGSYGLFASQLGATLQTGKNSSLNFRTAFQKSDGYRDQTAMKRFSSQLDWNYSLSEKSTMKTSFLVSDLFYETPGGLTIAQFEDDPTQARPATPTLPGTEEQKAAVNNTTTYLSTLFEHEWRKDWTTRAGLFASHTSFKNPTIRNYEVRDESNWGGRMETQYHVAIAQSKNKITLGGEYQAFHSPVAIYTNNGGTRGTLQVEDRLQTSGGLVFLQMESSLPAGFFATLGGSVNFLSYEFHRTQPTDEIQQRDFIPSLFPRLAILKKFGDRLSLFGSISNGFSPPSLAEVRPSTNAYNNTLQPERGLNMEVGARRALTNAWSFDLVAYDFRLSETIIIQRNADGADYFVNAGKTKQQGIELTLAWNPLKANTDRIVLGTRLSYALQSFRFVDYVQDGVDYTNKRLTGVAPNLLVLAIDLVMPMGLYINSTVTYSDHVPLQDANTSFAEKYWLIGSRLGYKPINTKIPFDLFVGVDNALDQTYSLGNDLNAAGGRYYNAAPTRNFYVGITFLTKRKVEKASNE